MFIFSSDDSNFEEDDEYGSEYQVMSEGGDENYEDDYLNAENYEDYCDEEDGNCNYNRYTGGDNQNDQKCHRSEVDEIYKAMQSCMNEKIGSDSKVPE